MNIVTGALEKAGLIKHSRNQITVLDWKGLEASSCDCYRIIKEEFARVLVVVAVFPVGSIDDGFITHRSPPHAIGSIVVDPMRVSAIRRQYDGRISTDVELRIVGVRS